TANAPLFNIAMYYQGAKIPHYCRSVTLDVILETPMMQELLNVIQSFKNWPLWGKALAGISVVAALFGIISFLLQIYDRVKGPERQKNIIKEALKEVGLVPPITIERFERQLDTFKKKVASQRLENAILYFKLGTERRDDKKYEEAVDNFQKALELLPPDTDVAAAVQFNLGIAYGDLADIKDREKSLELATNAFSSALKVYTPEKDAKTHAGVKFNLGRIYLLKADMYCEKEDIKQIKKSLKMAETSFTESLELFRKQGMKHWEEEADKQLTVVRELIDQVEKILTAIQ
ncbi:MAG: hypothetical protein ACE5IC_04475, partial [Candidatus Brocadiales bacterium]